MTLTELRADYPLWTIEQEPRRYSARIPHWGAVYGQNLNELAQRLKHHDKQVRAFHAAYPKC